jgi:carbamoyl-phosphate synthase large subunit
VLVRPSFVLGGRAMAIVFSEGFFTQYCTEAFAASEGRPVLIDQFLENAIELDVDCLCDGTRVTIGGIMEHVEKAGIHSGDSACFLPPRSLSPEMLDRIRATTREFALALHVRGLMNVQYAVQDGELYMIEVNPRASRTVPFAGKATGVPLAALAARVMAGESLADVGFEREVVLRHCAVKEAVLPFARFTGCRMQLTPEMHSTGEVMGLDLEPGPAFAKSQQAAGNPLPLSGGVFVSVSSECADDREGAIACAREMAACGYVLYATRETATALRDAGIPALAAFAVSEGRPNAIDLMADGTVGWIVDLPSGCLPLLDDVAVRTEAICRDVPMTTTLRGWRAALEALRAQRQHPELEVMSLQEYHRATARRNERSL